MVYDCTSFMYSTASIGITERRHSLIEVPCTFISMYSAFSFRQIAKDSGELRHNLVFEKKCFGLQGAQNYFKVFF